MDDAGEALKDSQFCATVARADGLIIVAPEYNHSFPGLLKHVLDTNLKEYIHKAVGGCGARGLRCGGFCSCFSCSFLLRLSGGCRVREILVNRLCLDGMNLVIIPVRFGKLLFA